eukprot:773130_1
MSVNANEIVSKLKEIRNDVQQLESEKKELETDIENRKLLSMDIRRALHWVIKVGNLKKSIDFYTKVFGMKVIRHEEFDDGCEAKCNGDFNRPWSKTMIGYGDEKKQFALELTYNYGVKGYKRGNDLRFIGLHITKNGFKNAQQMGYEPKQCDDTKIFFDIIGPDEIKYRCKITNDLTAIKEPFWTVALNVQNVGNSFAYWCGVLRMQSLSFIKDKYLRAAYGGQVPLEFYQLDKDAKLDHASAQGRIAFTTSIKKGPCVINDYINSYNKNKIEYIIHTKPVTLP